jgi:hypothetical protein
MIADSCCLTVCVRAIMKMGLFRLGNYARVIEQKDFFTGEFKPVCLVGSMARNPD